MNPAGGTALSPTFAWAGTLVIPAKMSRRFALKEGGMVVLEETADGISIRPAICLKSR